MATEPADVAHLLKQASRFLHPELLRGERVLTAFAGLRVLPRGEEAALDASRDHLLSVGPGGIVSVAGGKLTTHRRIALDALRHLPDTLRPRRMSLSDTPLPGASRAPAQNLRSRLDGSTVDHLLHSYGAEADKLLVYATEVPNALAEITPEAPDLWAQVHHAIREEWAVTAEDMIHRRTTLGLRGLDTPETRDEISAVIESRAGAETPPRGLTEQTRQGAG